MRSFSTYAYENGAGVTLWCWRGEENRMRLLGQKWDKAIIFKAVLALKEAGTYTCHPEGAKSV